MKDKITDIVINSYNKVLRERKEFYLIFFQRLVPYSVIFVLFQLSFLRLPTEEGHLIPALFSFFIMLSYIKIPTRTQVMVFILVFTSNLAYLDLFDFDVPNHVQKVEFAPRIESGLLVKDYQERAKKAVKEDFVKSQINNNNEAEECLTCSA